MNSTLLPAEFESEYRVITPQVPQMVELGENG